MPKFKDAPDGERATIDGTEVVPLGSSDATTSWWASISTILSTYIRTAVSTFTNKTLDNTNTVTLKDTLFTIQDDGDATKQAKFQASGITAGQTRTLTIPDASDTIVGLAASQTLTNKTLTTPTIGSFTNATHSHADAAGGGAIPVFKTIAVSGQSDVVADSVTDTLTLVAGSNITITTNAGADSITITGSAGGSVATDAIFDAKGDLAVGTGADTAAKLSVGANGTVLVAASGEATGLKWDTLAGTGDFVGPGSSTDNAIVRFDGTTGKLGQNSLATVSDTGTVNIPTGETYNINGSAHTHSYAPNAFSTVAVSGQSDVVADSATDTLTLAAGTNVTLTTNAGTDTVTIAASGGSNTLYVTGTRVDVKNDNTEQTALSYSVPGGTLSTANALRVTIQARVIHSIAGTLTVRFKYGATTMLTITVPEGATTADKSTDIWFLLTANGATNTQRVSGRVDMQDTVGAAGTHTLANVAGIYSRWNQEGTATEDSTASKTLAVTVQWGSASNSLEYDQSWAGIEKIG